MLLSSFIFQRYFHLFVKDVFCCCVFTSSHHFLLHGRMCGDCAAEPDAMCQKSRGTCRGAKVFQLHLTALYDKVKLVLLLYAVSKSLTRVMGEIVYLNHFPYTKR